MSTQRLIRDVLRWARANDWRPLYPRNRRRGLYSWTNAVPDPGNRQQSTLRVLVDVALDKPKPARVDDRYRYWGEAPPELSERCRYWLRQVERGWRPNRHILRGDYDGQAEWYGVYIWELQNVLWIRLAALEGVEQR